MKIETYLNAMEKSRGYLIIKNPTVPKNKRGKRQYYAFRDRILREFAIYKNFAVANGFDRNQAWFWTDEWQAAEQEVDAHIRAGEIESFDSMDEFLATLEEETNDSND